MLAFLCRVSPAEPDQDLNGPATAAAVTGNSELRDAAARWVGRHCMAFYLAGEKVGFEVNSIHIEEADPRPLLRMTTESRYEVEMFGERSVTEVTASEWFTLEGEGELVRYLSEQTEDGTKTVVRGTVKDGRFEVERTVAGETSRRSIERPKASLRETLRLDQFLSSKTEPRAVLETWSIDDEAEDFNLLTRTTLVARESVGSGADARTVYEVDSESDGMVVRVKAYDAVRLISMKAGGLMEGRAEPEATARWAEAARVDMKELSFVRIERNMGAEAADLKEVVLLVEGVAGFGIPASPEQSVERIGDGKCRVRLQRESRTATVEALDDQARAKFVREEAGIECDSEAIRSRANSIVGSVTDPVARVALIQRWVYQNMGKGGKQSNSALAILKQRSGDCTEHARLFVALARSLGLPSREVGGLLYFNDGRPGFGWHAWAEVHDGVRWIGVDPSWDQVGLDAGHLGMHFDQDDMSWVNILGSLKISVESFSAALN